MFWLFLELLLDGFKAFLRSSPNMNTLVGFGACASFLISAVSIEALCFDLEKMSIFTNWNSEPELWMYVIWGYVDEIG